SPTDFCGPVSCGGSAGFQDEDVRRGRRPDLEVAPGAPLRQEVPVVLRENIARLAGRLDEARTPRISKIDDLPVTRSVTHLEGSILSEGAHVHGRDVAALADLEIEKPAQPGDLMENVVGKNGAMQALPLPAGRVRPEALLQEGDRAREGRRSEVRA